MWKAMRLFTRPITATLLLLAGGCAGAREPAPTAAPQVDSAADAPVDPVADAPVDSVADLRAPPAADPPAPIPTPPTCDDWAEWNFFESASAEIVRACLLQAGADIAARDPNGETPLHLAAGFRNAAAVAALLEAGADVHATTRRGDTPLHDAARYGSAEIVNALLEAGADVHATSRGGDTPLHAAARHGGTAIANASLAQLYPGADVRGAEIVNALLDAGADVNVGAGGYGTPLRFAAALSGGTISGAVNALLEAGADVNFADSSGNTPLLAAATNPPGEWPRPSGTSAELPLKLLALGADPNARGSGGVTPLYKTALGVTDAPRVIRALLEAGANPRTLTDNGASALHAAAERRLARTPEVITLLVDAGMDVNARNALGETPLHLARTYNILPAVTSALLDAGADPGARDLAGSTPLQFAASVGWDRQVSLLAAAGADVNARDNRGRTPLHVARNPATIRTLLGLGADPAARDSAGTSADPAACERWGSEVFFAFATADIVAGCIADGADAHTIADGSQATALLFTAAASTPDPAVVSMLLAAGADVHARDGGELTPLHHAARSGTPKVARALLGAGADVDAWAKGFYIDWGWGWTPLHLAAKSNPDPEVARVLVEAGADLQAPGEESYFHGNTPLHYAGDNANPDVAAALLSAGADVGALSATGRTPLHEAAANASSPATIELLVAAGADVNTLDSRGYAPLHSAAYYNPRPEIATALIAAGADVNARDPHGYVPPGRAANHRTPLLMALYRGGWSMGGQPMPTGRSVPVVEVLVRAGAKVEQADESGLTALHMAAIWTPDAFPLLLRLGADPNALDANGKTPWDYALRNRSLHELEEVRRMREEMRRGGAERE